MEGIRNRQMAELFTLNTLASFLALTFLEVVLSVDNILFVAIAAAQLPAARRGLGRQLGLWLALVLRVAMLAGLVWVTRLDFALFHVLGRDVSLKDLVLIAGGMFLLWKGSTEIHDNIDNAGEDDEAAAPSKPSAGLLGVVLQIGLINIVFSLDPFDDARRQAGWGLYRPPPDGEDAGASVHPSRRGDADRRRRGFRRASRLSLFRYRILPVR
jgi:predicted tellurium resistance membrane protein TerC